MSHASALAETRLPGADPAAANRAWSDAWIRRVDRTFRHRWELFDELLIEYLTPRASWLDVGCGDNRMVEGYGGRARLSVGVDPLWSGRAQGRFVATEVSRLPFADASFDLVTLRFVAEHLPHATDLGEVARVLAPGGHAIILTTNARSPVIAATHAIPFAWKQRLLSALFRVDPDSIHPTHHHVNERAQWGGPIAGLDTLRVESISDLNYTRRWLFLVLLAWHAVTRLPGLSGLRTNVLVVARKAESPG